jgi:transposase-like protein
MNVVEPWGRDSRTEMRRSYTVEFKRKMVAKLIGRNAKSAGRLSRECGVSQATLSQWKLDAGSLGGMPTEARPRQTYTWTRKAEILSAAAELDGEQLAAYLARENVSLSDFEQWRAALQDSHHPSVTATKRIKQLEREVARKDKALAEAATLLILKKKLEDYLSGGEDENTEPEIDA